MMERVFKPYVIRGAYPSPLNEEVAWKVGHSTGQYLKRSRQSLSAAQKVGREGTILVGRDARTHSPDLAGALMDGLRSTGMNVINLGVIDTSMIYFAINHLDTVGGIQVTASHAPAAWNGFKISGPKARPVGAAGGLEDIRRIATLLRVGQTGVRGAMEEADLWPPYRAHVLKFLELKRPIRVVVDAGNGAAAKMIPAIFGTSPDLEIISLHFDGPTLDYDPNPQVEANLKDLQDKVRETGADGGVCFDADADECVFVDEAGRTAAGDCVTALLAHDYLSHASGPPETVIYDVRSSRVVPQTIRSAGGTPRRERVGHSFIRKAMAETKAVLAGERSGHFYFRDNLGADSGAIAFARVMSILSGQTLPFSRMLRPFRRFSQSGELTFPSEDREARIREVADHYKKAKTDYLDGVTIDLGSWWFNLRKSLSEPVLRLNLEAESAVLRDAQLQEITRMLHNPSKK